MEKKFVPVNKKEVEYNANAAAAYDRANGGTGAVNFALIGKSKAELHGYMEMGVAKKLNDFYKDYDPYGYNDCMENGETEADMVAKFENNLKIERYRKNIVLFLKDCLDEEWSEEVESLIEAIRNMTQM